MKVLNDFSISMFAYLQWIYYFLSAGIISIIFIFLELDSYGFELLAMIFIALPAAIAGVVYYLRYLYIHILLCRTYYAVENKPRFYLLVFFLILFLLPITAVIYAPISPFIVYFLVSITDKNKVKQVLNLEYSDDFYQFKKFRKALLEQLKQST